MGNHDAEAQARLAEPRSSKSAERISLTDALSALGIEHHRDWVSEADGRHSWYASDGSFLGRFDAHEGWAHINGGQQ